MYELHQSYMIGGKPQAPGGYPGRKSRSNSFTASGASSCIQCPGPSMTSYRHVPVTWSAEPSICASVRAKSPLLHTPMVGACTGGSSMGGSTYVWGGTLARYQLRAGVSDPVASMSAMTPSTSGCPPQSRRLAQSLPESHCSAMPSNWNRSMYHDFSRWTYPADTNDEGWPTDSATRWSTRSGSRDPNAHARAAPQS